MIETSFDLLWQSSVIFGKCWEMFRKCLKMFVWPSEQFWKIFGNFSSPSHIQLDIKISS